jgi:nitroreductase / dihydropteridine reductase
MVSMSIESINKAHNSRYSVKQFTSEVINPEAKAVLIDSINLAPTSYGLQPFKVVIVESADLKQAILPIAYGQVQVSTAESIIIWCGVDSYERAVQDYNTRLVESGRLTEEKAGGFAQYLLSQKDSLSTNNQSIVNWYAKQAYLSLGFAMATASVLEIDSCAMEGFDHAKLDELLGLKGKGLTSLVMLTIGVGDHADTNKTAPKVRKTQEGLIIKL